MSRHRPPGDCSAVTDTIRRGDYSLPYKEPAEESICRGQFSESTVSQPLGGNFMPQKFLGFCHFRIPFGKLLGCQEINDTLTNGRAIVYNFLDYLFFGCMGILLPKFLDFFRSLDHEVLQLMFLFV